MPSFKIHWKGYPHHRLPRIRVTSRSSVRSRRTSQENTGLPCRASRPALQQVRKKRGFFRFRRRRARSSRSTRSTRSTTSAHQARKRASLRARQNIQVFGWDSPAADLASRVTSRRNSASNPISAIDPRTRSAFWDPVTQTTTTLVSTDGAGSSVIRQAKGIRSKRKKPEEQRPYTPVINTPLYKPEASGANQEKGPVGPIETVSRRVTHFDSPERSYDPRIAPSNRVENEPRVRGSRTESKPPLTRHSTLATRASSKVKPQENFADPEFWKAVNSIVLQPKVKGAVTPSIKSAVRTFLSDNNSSRSPSQRKALRKFTKELELYLQATRSLPKQSLIPSPSATTVSADTIEPLKPYQAQFQSAGLAVTSEEQRGMASKSNKLQKPSPPPTPPKDATYGNATGKNTEPTNDRKSNNRYREPSFASESTGTTVLGFTPHHEKTYGSQKEPLAKRGLSSDHTVLGFTPPDAASQPKRPAPDPPKKKSLPWLRKPESSEEPLPAKKTTKRSTVQAEDVMRDMVLPTSPQPERESFASYKIVEFPSKAETWNIVKTPKNFSRDQRSPDIRWKSLKYSNEETVDEQPRRSSRQRTATASQTQNINMNNAKSERVEMAYAEMGTQTSVDPIPMPILPIECTRKHEEVIVERAPIPSGRTKTFPLNAPKCPGDCKPDTKMIPVVPPRPKTSVSKVKWVGLNRETQTENVENLDPLEPETREPEKPASSSPKRMVDRTRTFPFTSATLPKAIPAHSSPVSRSPNKSVDETRIIPSPIEGKGVDYRPTRTRTSQPFFRCTQCNCEIQHGNSEVAPEFEQERIQTMDPGPESEFGPDPEIELEVEPETEFVYDPQPLGPTHVCRERSSIQCQQCFPSRQPSTAVPLRQPSVSIIQRPRGSTRPLIPTEPIIYTYQYPIANEQQIINDRPPQEEQLEQPDTAQDPFVNYTTQPSLADPMKRPSLPKLKLRPAPVPQAPPKQVKYIPTPRKKTLPPVPQPPIILTTTIPFTELASSSSLDTYAPQPDEISDKSVFRGLHVATAAACDEDVDKWISEITGIGVREFLSQLSKFDGLGVSTLAGVAKRAKKQRRGEVLGWEVLREARSRGVEIQIDNDPAGAEFEDEAEERYDVGLSPKTKETKSPMVVDKEVLMKDMRHARECKASEGVRDRAARMGWRERSYSGGVGV